MNTGRFDHKAVAGSSIAALLPRGENGHQFVCYADCCSGIPGTPNESTFAQINAVLRKLQPQPEFISFPGDEIRGLLPDADALRSQWKYWLENEMGWLDPSIPLYHTTGNHTAYDALSQNIFREMLPHLPHNGPAGQVGLSYYVELDDCLLVFVNTLNLALGGEGYVDTAWLDAVLTEHQDVPYKIVFGHHPVFPVNGFSGAYQRQLGTANGQRFWEILSRHAVMAYFCSHMLAFDVQVHQGILQIMTAGAGTAPLMPEDREYHHLVQAAVDDTGLRYQVIDHMGRRREGLSWPPQLPPLPAWQRIPPHGQLKDNSPDGKLPLLAWRFQGTCYAGCDGHPQTLLSCWNNPAELPQVWIGCRGYNLETAVLLRHTPGRSPHLWTGPQLIPGEPFDMQIVLHPGMGPGGVLWRRTGDQRWSSMAAASPWGPERLAWATHWSVGYDHNDPFALPFHGQNLSATWVTQELPLP